MQANRRYSELIRFDTFLDRFEYLRLGGCVGESTFGFDRYINQAFYRSREWRKARDIVIARDNGFDIGHPDYRIGNGLIIVHHMNPITMEQIEDRDPDIFNPEYLISVSTKTHTAIHYSDMDLLPSLPVLRTPGDTCPWK